MKKEKIDDNPLTFFDVIDGGKHEEDKKNIVKIPHTQGYVACNTNRS